MPARIRINPRTLTLEAFLMLDTVAVVGGTWIARKEDLAAGNRDDIRQRCTAALEIVARAGGPR